MRPHGHSETRPPIEDRPERMSVLVISYQPRMPSPVDSHLGDLTSSRMRFMLGEVAGKMINSVRQLATILLRLLPDAPSTGRCLCCR
jgi:hypothetical protein